MAPREADSAAGDVHHGEAWSYVQNFRQAARDLDPVPCVVLDPFLGSGTTALVARRLGRKCVGIELNAEYARLAAKRLSQLSLLADEAA